MSKKPIAFSKLNRFFNHHSDSLITLGLLFLISLVISVFLSGLKPKDNLKPVLTPIKHLIASLSGQKEAIKIDPAFSYENGKNKPEAPIKLLIPSVKIDVNVVPAEIVDGFWETATASASFGLGSSHPQETGGNTVIFAHAKPGLFADLRLVKKDDLIYLFTASKWFTYKVSEIKTVLPNQVEVVSPTQDKTLTLYTCTGYKDALRLVLIAKPI